MVLVCKTAILDLLGSYPLYFSGRPTALGPFNILGTILSSQLIKVSVTMLAGAFDGIRGIAIPWCVKLTGLDVQSYNTRSVLLVARGCGYSCLLGDRL